MVKVPQAYCAKIFGLFQFIHLIKTPRDSHRIAQSEALASYHQFVHLLYDDNFVHAPFNFIVTTQDRQSRERIVAKDWIALHTMIHFYSSGVSDMQISQHLSTHCSSLSCVQVNFQDVDKRVLVAHRIQPNI